MADESVVKDLVNRFTFHPAEGDQPERYAAIRSFALELALLIEDNAPHSRERSLAFTKLQEAVMWANAAIAVNE